ncbi:something about silencing protein 10 [Copidosoma floridanum]|uniref:something about silencing protein 10 n=1 Tax=Copidosoma floridanum TaxID=29053 RepID=UPI0006C965A0|nr:something about silencing protein 10 [Copidosoma floridanum]
MSKTKIMKKHTYWPDEAIVSAAIDYEDTLLHNNKILRGSEQPEDLKSYNSEDEVMTFNDKDRKIQLITSSNEDIHENFVFPNDKAWGQKKKIYFSTDYVDADYASASRVDTINAELEEKEARNIQKRLAQQLDETDFGLDTLRGYDCALNKSNEQIKTNIDQFNHRQKHEFLKNECPELAPLIADSKERLAEAKTALEPFLSFFNDPNYNNTLVSKFIKVKYDIILHYCTNISFYLVLKSKQDFAVTHPIIKRLAQYRDLLSKIENNQDLLQYITRVLQANRNNCSFNQFKQTIERYANNKNTSKNLSENIENNYTIVENAIENRLFVKYKPSNSTYEDPDFSTIVFNEAMEISGFDGEKRGITQKMEKNRGLTPYRKKELRNPRVRHRNKYRKAKISRKGAVREIREKTKRYTGEKSGIKASISKSIKLK